MSAHRCDLPHCDLAADFPEETARFDEAMRRLTHPDDYANPMRDEGPTDKEANA